MNIFIQLCHFKRFYKKICSFRFNFNPFFKACHFLYWVSNDKLPNQVNSKFFDLFILQKKSWWEKCWYCSTSTNSLVFEMNLFWSWKSLLNNFYEIFKSKSFLNWFVLFDSTLGLLTNLLMICLVNCLDIKGLLINHLIIDGMLSCLDIKELF